MYNCYDTGKKGYCVSDTEHREGHCVLDTYAKGGHNVCDTADPYALDTAVPHQSVTKAKRGQHGLDIEVKKNTFSWLTFLSNRK